MPETTLYPRYATERLTEALADSPAVLIHGPRQCGKTTLAQIVGKQLGYEYLTFDNDVTRSVAESDPIGFVADLPARAILDEVQHVPHLFTSLKLAIDRERTPGRFLLTGSANVLLVPKLADSLAGRMSILRLHPLSQAELRGRDSGFLDRLFEGRFKFAQGKRLAETLPALVAGGGYPAALALPAGRRRGQWYSNYVETIVQRDIRELARIAELDALPRLLRLIAAQTSRLLNITDLAAPFQLSRPTIRDYVALLSHVFLIEQLPPWFTNRLSRLVKTPKLHIGDTGLACALLETSASDLNADRALLGQLVETFVFQELRRQASWHESRHSFFHFRDRDDFEVDIVIERGVHSLVGVEVKAGATVSSSDFRGLRKLQDAAGARFKTGVVVYDGETCAGFGKGLYAVPLRALWESAPKGAGPEYAPL